MAGPAFPHLKRIERAMLPEVAEIFGRHQAGSARSLQRHIGPSEVGHPCERHLAYKLAGVPAVNVEPIKWAALVGTWGHAGAEEAMRQENVRLGRERYLVEKRAYIEPDLVPSGSTDVFDTDHDEVDDWKFVGESSLAKYRRHGASRLYIVQAMLYGLGWSRMGRTVKSIRILFLPRHSNDFGEAYEYAVEYDERIALAALDRLRVIAGAGNLAAGGLVPWTEIEHDTSECKFCPWLMRKADSAPDADQTGCVGFYRRAGRDLDRLGGIEPQGESTPAERLAVLIRHAQHPQALSAMWRNAHDGLACRCKERQPCGQWLPAHTDLAAKQRAELAQ